LLNLGESPGGDMDICGKAIWITWHEHRRTRSLVSWLGTPVFVYDDHRPVQRNIVGPLWAIGVLMKQKPDVVFTHFSFLLQFTIMIYKYLFRFGRVTVISDCHNKALKREISGPFNGLFLRFKKALFWGVDLIIVTNTSLVPLAKKMCQNAVVLRDPLTDWQGEDQEIRNSGLVNEGHVLFICSFDKDEPVDLIFESAFAIAKDLGRKVVISGKVPTRLVPNKIMAHNGISLPGYMPLKQYKETLFTAAAVVVLTEDTDCLVCGAFESLGASRPTILSDTAGLKECFMDSAVYSMHTPSDIVEKVRLAIGSPKNPEESRKAFENAWGCEWDSFKSSLNGAGISKM